VKTIRNKTFKPLQDHVLRWQGAAPRTGEERAGADSALEQKSILALVKAETIEILDGGPSHVAGADTTSAGRTRSRAVIGRR